MKRLIQNIIFIVALFYAPSVLCQAQDTKIVADSIVPNGELPELRVFLDSAIISSPLLKVSDKQISQVFEQIKIEKKSWSDYLSLDANAKYGLYNQISLSDITAATASDAGIQSKNQQLNYFFGVTFKLPFSDIATKKNKLKILNDNIDEKQQQKEELKNQLKQLIVEQYYNLIYLNKSMKINQNMLQSMSINLMKAERDIQTGIITLENYNAMVYQQGKAEDSFYKAKSEYYAQYKKLMIICGLKY